MSYNNNDMLDRVVDAQATYLKRPGGGDDDEGERNKPM
jgi:hypothetical protein